jgi:hypothetical protein
MPTVIQIVSPSTPEQQHFNYHEDRQPDTLISPSTKTATFPSGKLIVCNLPVGGFHRNNVSLICNANADSYKFKLQI